MDHPKHYDVSGREAYWDGLQSLPSPSPRAHRPVVEPSSEERRNPSRMKISNPLKHSNSDQTHTDVEGKRAKTTGDDSFTTIGCVDAGEFKTSRENDACLKVLSDKKNTEIEADDEAVTNSERQEHEIIKSEPREVTSQCRMTEAVNEQERDRNQDFLQPFDPYAQDLRRQNEKGAPQVQQDFINTSTRQHENTKIERKATKQKMSRLDERTTAHVKDLELKLHTLDAQKSELQKTCNDLRSQLQAKDEKHYATKTRLLQKLQDARGINQRYSRDVDDSTIERLFGVLKSKVVRFVTTYTQTVKLSATEEVEDPELAGLMEPSMLRASLASCPMYLMVFEAYIWRWLRNEVFSFDSVIWAGSLGGDFGILSHSIKKDLVKNTQAFQPLEAELQEWTSRSCYLLNKIAKHHHKPQETIRGPVTNMVEWIGGLCKNLDSANAMKDGMDMVFTARLFDIERRLLKSIVSFGSSMYDSNGKRARYGFAFDHDTMIDRFGKVGATQQATADLVVCPALIKRGNTDGGDYHLTSYLHKMNVVTDVEQYTGPPPMAEKVAGTKNGGNPAQVDSNTVDQRLQFDTGTADFAASIRVDAIKVETENSVENVDQSSNPS